MQPARPRLTQYCILCLLAGLLAAGCASAPAAFTPTPLTRYYAETGHTVQGDFLISFDAFGGAAGLGLPITQEFTVNGWTVQYFEMGRLERHPENEAAYRVTVGWLGDLLHRRRPPVDPGAIPPALAPHRRYFAQTGHTVSGDFLQYFDTHGGSVRFGLPISEPFLDKGRLAQDFQSARFFWEPERLPPVTLEETGRLHFEAAGLNPRLLAPVSP
jgi:hypothetical protein